MRYVESQKFCALTTTDPKHLKGSIRVKDLAVGKRATMWNGLVVTRMEAKTGDRLVRLETSDGTPFGMDPDGIVRPFQEDRTPTFTVDAFGFSGGFYGVWIKGTATVVFKSHDREACERMAAFLTAAAERAI